MATETATIKRCIKCAKDLTGQKRMRDSKGIYWCVDCGAADRKQKGEAGGICAACGDQFPAGELSKWGTQMLCSKCVRGRSRGPGLMDRLKSLRGGGGSAGGSDRGRTIKMLVVMAILAAIAVWRYMPSS